MTRSVLAQCCSGAQRNTWQDAEGMKGCNLLPAEYWLA